MFNKIIATTNKVIKNSKSVTINEQKLNEFASNIKDLNIEHWLASNPFGILNLPKEELVTFILLYGAIDFSFWGTPKWTVIMDDEKKIDGAFALIYTLLKETKTNPSFLSGTYLKDLTLVEAKRIFKGNVEIPLLEERLYRLKEIGKVLESKFQNQFYLAIENVTTDIDLFQLLIDSFSFLTDTRTHYNDTVYFYKLAQLMTSDILHLRSIKENIEIDVSHLVGCADYKLPQVLHQYGILVYTEELEQTLIQKIEIPENSIEEVEIRAATIVAIQNLSKLTDIDAIKVNDAIWLKGQDKTLNPIPYHLTRTSSY